MCTTDDDDDGSVKFATKCFTFTVGGEEEGEETLAIDGEAMAFLPTLQLSPDGAHC